MKTRRQSLLKAMLIFFWSGSLLASGCQPAEVLIPTFTPNPTATLTPAPTATLTPPPTITLTSTATPIPCLATTDAEYIISGSPDPDAGIFVDDILRIFINGNRVTQVSQGGRCCTPVPPIHFLASTGDILRVQAQDANNCYSLEALWLQMADGTCLTPLARDIYGPNCNSEPPLQIFFDQTFDLP